jgi:hypothetical protein
MQARSAGQRPRRGARRGGRTAELASGASESTSAAKPSLLPVERVAGRSMRGNHTKAALMYSIRGPAGSSRLTAATSKRTRSREVHWQNFRAQRIAAASRSLRCFKAETLPRADSQALPPRVRTSTTASVAPSRARMSSSREPTRTFRPRISSPLEHKNEATNSSARRPRSCRCAKARTGCAFRQTWSSEA